VERVGRRERRKREREREREKRRNTNTHMLISTLFKMSYEYLCILHSLVCDKMYLKGDDSLMCDMTHSCVT